VDVVAIVAGLDGDYNPRRLERALVLAWDGGAQPVIVLNKADLLGPDELAATVRATEDVAPGVSVLAVSAATGEGLDGLERSLARAATAALIGSSGVGKSTLVNRLLGAERQRTNAVRTHDSRGRHTTTHRELLRLPRARSSSTPPGCASCSSGRRPTPWRARSRTSTRWPRPAASRTARTRKSPAAR
jgi:ribosome biogenesis GTPase